MTEKAVKETVFIVPVLDRYLFYAPLHQLTALIDEAGISAISAGLESSGKHSHPTIQPIVEWLLDKPINLPTERVGPIVSPIFLGLIPTRGCNLGCRYCDFPSSTQTEPMGLDLARDAVDEYFELISYSGGKQCEIHFFGGEPFSAEDVVHFFVEYARMKASQLDISLHLEATTNGFYPASRCRWIADYFDTIVLSLDGPAEFHDFQRPTKNLRPSFERVYENARIFSNSQVEFILRVCVTADMVSSLPQIAKWICEELAPAAVCFETLTPSSQTQGAGLIPPDPLDFGRSFFAAESILEDYGIRTVNSTASIEKNQVSCCPVGKDALIVSPDGAINACYLLKDSWERKGMDMQLGEFKSVESKYKMHIDKESVQRVRRLNVNNKSRCSECFCRYHCSGGCHVNHPADVPAGQYDDLCVQTRIITVTKLLRKLGQQELAANWLESQSALEKSALQRSDLLRQDAAR